MSRITESTIDYDRLEREYRAGILTLREMASACGCTEGAIRKRAKRDGWSRDLTAKIHQAADELVRKEAVRKTVRKSKDSAYQDAQVVELNAQAIATVRLGQRRDIQRARALANKLLSELELQTDHPTTYDELAVLLREGIEGGSESEGENKTWGKREMAFEAAISLPERTKTMKACAEVLQRLVALEREAFGIGPVKEGENEGAVAPAAGTPREHYQWLSQQKPVLR